MKTNPIHIVKSAGRVSTVIGAEQTRFLLNESRLALGILLLAFIQCPGASAEGAHPEQIASRLAETLQQLSVKAAESVAKQQGNSPVQTNSQRLAAPRTGDSQLHLRRANGTVLQMRGRNLTEPRQGVAKAAPARRPEEAAMDFLQSNAVLLRLKDPSIELTLTANQQDELGQRHLRYQQVHNGLSVWPAGLSLHFDRDGNLTTLDGAYVPTPEVQAIQPIVSGPQAVARARSVVPLSPATFNTEPELILYAPLGQAPRLAWKFELTASLQDAWLFVVDALNGRILRRGERVLDGNVAGSGTDLAGATRTLNLWQQSTTYYMADTSKKSYDPKFDPLRDPHGVITITDAQGTPVDKVLDMTVATVSSTAPGQWAVPAAVSASFHFSETFDYYLERHGRNSLDGQGGNITAMVRVGNYDNASWHGNLRVMLFGDVKPFAGSLDVVAHELTHGVTENSAGLIYENQPGALNESFSDILGEMVEARTLGRADWLVGTGLEKAYRNFRDPGSIICGLIGRGYPAKMSEFADMPSDSDHGGVHINSSIINHAFYLLAEGLDGAIGLRDAERVFYRTLTQHLHAQSEFIDCRLACMAAAEELFGPDSTQARKTAQAFDAVEIFAAPGTPDPTPVPTVTGPDSTLFIYYDIFSDELTLARREAEQGDGEAGTDLASNVRMSRPAVTGDGSFALFVDPDFDLCGVDTTDPDSRVCLGYPGMVHSVAISPDGRMAAFVLRNPDSGETDGKINVLDLAKNQVKTFNLVAPSADGVSVDAVLYADGMTFSTDSRFLIYDALSQLKFGHGPTVQLWSIYSLDLVTEQTAVLVPPQAGVDAGNPAFGRAGNRYLAYDAKDQTTGASSIMVLDLFTGHAAKVATAQDGFAYPSFLGDESAIIYLALDANALSGYSLFKQDLTSERLGKVGDPTLWLRDAVLGIIYRRGEFSGTNALPTVTLQVTPPQATAAASFTLSATAADADGAVARVEFYNGSTKLGEATQPPYSYVWANVAEGQFRLTARAIDNLGASADSAPITVVVTGSAAGNRPTLSLAALPGKAVRLTLKGVPGNYIIEQSIDLKSWVPIYPITLDPSGVGSLDDAGGPANYETLFYRVRHE